MRGKISGQVRLRAVGADPEGLLSRLAAAGVPFRLLAQPDAVTLELLVPLGQMGRVRQCARGAMCQLEPLKTQGAGPFARRMGLRVCYPAILAALAAGVFWLQGHLMFFTVSGNGAVPEEKILRALEQQGVGFFTPADQVDVGQVKNAVLSQMPELSWLTINARGSWAEVVVRERERKPAMARDSAPANVVARKDGLITSVAVTGGTAQVKKGDVVRAGELLISGVTDLDRLVLLTRAAGEIQARTWNPVRVILPENRGQKVYTGRSCRRYSLVLGKKKINFYKTSGISYPEYDKITETSILRLPGGYTFPAALEKTVFQEYRRRDIPGDLAQAQAQMERAARRQVKAGMVAGQVLQCRGKAATVDGGYALQGVLECAEEIGQTKDIQD